jgi:HD-GYP domain-containing protein (c-di-GMP phosphodiesterase class II)
MATQGRSDEPTCPHCRASLPEAGRFCPQCGRALESSRETEGVYTWAMEDLFEIARTLSSTLDLDVLLKKIGKAAEKLTDAEASSILLLDDDRKNLYFKTATGEKGHAVKKFTVPVGTGLAGWVAREWKPVIVNDVSKDDRFMKKMDDSTGFVTRSVLAVPLMLGGELVGVCEAINKRAAGGFDTADRNILQNLANFAAVSIMNARLVETQQNFFTNMIEILTAAIEARDPRYLGHPSRVAELACAIGRKLGVEGQAYRDLYYGSLLHDIGMIALNHRVLTEQATLLAQERSVERIHPVLGAELLKDVRMLHGILPVVRHHHEHWDGSGHPDRLAGERIPLAARILCLVEYLEDLRLSGVQEPELAPMQLQMARNGSGGKFDPRVVEAYLAVTAAPQETGARG